MLRDCPDLRISSVATSNWVLLGALAFANAFNTSSRCSTNSLVAIKVFIDLTNPSNVSLWSQCAIPNSAFASVVIPSWLYDNAA